MIPQIWLFEVLCKSWVLTSDDNLFSKKLSFSSTALLCLWRYFSAFVFGSVAKNIPIGHILRSSSWIGWKMDMYFCVRQFLENHGVTDSYSCSSFRLKNKPSTAKAINCGFPWSIHEDSMNIITISFSTLSAEFSLLEKVRIHLTTYPCLWWFWSWNFLLWLVK